MAADVKLNQTEFLALDGLPHMYRWAYVEIRKHMNFADGVVGIRRGISLTMLCEWLEVEPHPGRKSSKPSKDMVRSAIDALIKKGLLINKSIERHRLIFECVLASSDKSARKKVPAAFPQQVPTAETSTDAETSHKVPTAKKAEVPTHPVSRKTFMKTSSSSELSPAKTHEKEDEIRNLIYPKSTTPRQQKSMRKILSGIGDAAAQDLLDELHGRIEAKKNSPTPMGDAVSYLRGLVNDHKAGTFTPSMAITVQDQREQQKAIARQIEESKKAVLQEKPAEPKSARSTTRRSVKDIYEKATGKKS